MSQSPSQSLWKAVWDRGDGGADPRERPIITRSELQRAVAEGVRAELTERPDDRGGRSRSRKRLLLLALAVAAVAYLSRRYVGGGGDPEAVDVHAGRRYRQSPASRSSR